MSGRWARSRWCAALVPVLLLTALVAAVGGATSSAATSPGGADALVLHLGQPGKIDGFHLGEVVQGLDATDCEVSLTGEPLAVLTAGKPSDPQGAAVGRFEDILGTKGVSDNVGATGRPCGEIDNTETFEIALGSALADKHITSADVVIVRRSGPDFRFSIRALDADGNLVGQIQQRTSGEQTPVSVAVGQPYAALAITSLATNRAVSVANGTTLHLADAYEESLDCGESDTFTGHGVSVDLQVSPGGAKDGSPQECVVNFNLVIDQAPDGRSILFDPADSGFDVTFTVTIAWEPEPAGYPVPGTRFSVDDVPGPGEYPEFCDEGEPPAGSTWCILSQTTTSEEQGPGLMQVTETYVGKGDPLWLR